MNDKEVMKISFSKANVDLIELLIHLHFKWSNRYVKRALTVNFTNGFLRSKSSTEAFLMHRYKLKSVAVK